MPSPCAAPVPAPARAAGPQYGDHPAGIWIRVLQRILAFTAAIEHNDHINQPINEHSWPTTADGPWE